MMPIRFYAIIVVLAMLIQPYDAFIEELKAVFEDVGTPDVCGPGYYPEGWALNTCQPCMKGTFSTETNQEKCETCATDTYAEEIGQTSCKPCPKGHSLNSDFHIDPSKCEARCPPNSFEPTKYDCKSCGIIRSGVHRVSEAGNTEESKCYVPCDAGKYYNTRFNRCFKCAPGSYSDTGRQADGSCKTCAAGFYASEQQSTSCNSCSPGSYSLSGSRNCHPCEIGKFSDQSEAGACKPCAAGLYADVKGSKLCKACKLGTYSRPAAGSCSICEIGTYSGDRAGYCKYCSAGHFNTKVGMSDCYACGKGQFAAVRSNKCGLCDYGTFADTLFYAECGLCPSGRTTPNKGSTSIQDCSLTFKDLGCFQVVDYAGRVIPAGGRLYEPSIMTPRLCIANCHRQHYSRAALRAGVDCWCYNSHDKHIKIPESRCSSTCAGDMSVKCGGASANTLYTIVLTDGNDLVFDCDSRNPCSPLLVPGQHWYRHADPLRYVQCTISLRDGLNGCYIADCNKGFYFNGETLYCTQLL